MTLPLHFKKHSHVAVAIHLEITTPKDVLLLDAMGQEWKTVKADSPFEHLMVDTLPLL